MIKSLFAVNHPRFVMYTEKSLVFKLILRDVKAIQFAYIKYGPALYGTIHTQSTENIDLIYTRSFTRIINTVATYDSSKCRLFTWMYWIVMDELAINNKARDTEANKELADNQFNERKIAI